jgi:hypothetical protein
VWHKGLTEKLKSYGLSEGLKSKGPNTEPLGTPALSNPIRDSELLMNTICFLLEM